MVGIYFSKQVEYFTNRAKGLGLINEDETLIGFYSCEIVSISDECILFSEEDMEGLEQKVSKRLDFFGTSEVQQGWHFYMVKYLSLDGEEHTRRSDPEAYKKIELNDDEKSTLYEFFKLKN